MRLMPLLVIVIVYQWSKDCSEEKRFGDHIRVNLRYFTEKVRTQTDFAARLYAVRKRGLGQPQPQRESWELPAATQLEAVSRYWILVT